MVTMWAAAMYMQGAFTTYDNPITRWNAVINSPARFYKVCKHKKPPDKDPGMPLVDYGARLRWLHKQNTHTYWRVSNYSVVDPVDEAPDIPDFCWGNCPHSCKGCDHQRKKDDNYEPPKSPTRETRAQCIMAEMLWDHSGLLAAFRDGHHEMPLVTRKSLSSSVLNHEDHCCHKTGDCCNEGNVGAAPFPNLTKINSTNAS